MIRRYLTGPTPTFCILYLGWTMKRDIESRLQKLELRRGRSRLEDMTDQERNDRIEFIEKQLGGREKILIDLKARTSEDPSLLRFISLVEERGGAAT
jgi:hypothetical protein